MKNNKSDKELKNDEDELDNLLEDDFDDLLNDEEIDLSDIDLDDDTDLDLLLEEDDDSEDKESDIELMLDESDDESINIDDSDDDGLDELLEIDGDDESIEEDESINIDDDSDDDGLEDLLEIDGDDESIEEDEIITIDDDILENIDNDDDDLEDLLEIDSDDELIDEDEEINDDSDDESISELLELEKSDNDFEDVKPNNINSKSIIDDEDDDINMVDDINEDKGEDDLNDFFDEAESSIENNETNLFDEIEEDDEDDYDQVSNLFDEDEDEDKDDEDSNLFDEIENEEEDDTNMFTTENDTSDEILNLEKNKTNDINSTEKENNIMKNKELSKETKNSPIFIYGLSIVSAISLAGVIFTGVLFKDELKNKYDVLMGNPINAEVQLISKVEFENKSLELIDIIEKLEIKLTENQKANLEPILTSLRNKDGEMRSIRSKLNQQNQTLENLENLTNSQKENLVKSIKLTLSVIENAKIDGNGGYSESLYDALYTKLSEDLNAVSVSELDSLKIEQKNILKELRQEIKEIKTENIKLRGKVSKVEASMEQELKDKTVLEMLNNKKNNTIEITKTKSSSSSEPKAYNIVGIVAGIAYILPDGESSGGEPIMYQVNDYIPEYGKILNITTNQIIAEKGIVRKK